MGDNVISTHRNSTGTNPSPRRRARKDRWNWLGIHPHTPKLAKMRHEARQSDNGAPSRRRGRRVLEPEALMQQALVLHWRRWCWPWRPCCCGGMPIAARAAAVPPSWKTSCGARAACRSARGDIRRRGRAARSFRGWDRLLLLAGLRHGAGLRSSAPIVAGALLAWAFWAPCPASSRCALPDRRRLFPAVAARADKRPRRMIAIAGLPGQHGPAHHHRQQHGLGLPDRRRQRRRAAARSGRRPPPP